MKSGNLKEPKKKKRTYIYLWVVGMFGQWYLIQLFESNAKEGRASCPRVEEIRYIAIHNLFDSWTTSFTE